MTTLTSFQDLTDYLRLEGVTHNCDAAAQVVELATPVGTMLLRWDAKLPLVQIIQVAMVDVPDDKVGPVGQALAHINHVAPIAGFGLDPDRRFVYFRTTVLRDEQDHVPVLDFARAVRAAVGSAHDALPLIKAA
jgi:hypothetical protein